MRFTNACHRSEESGSATVFIGNSAKKNQSRKGHGGIYRDCAAHFRAILDAAREEIKLKIYSGKCSEEEVLELAKRFDEIKRERPQVATG